MTVSLRERILALLEKVIDQRREIRRLELELERKRAELAEVRRQIRREMMGAMLTDDERQALLGGKV